MWKKHKPTNNKIQGKPRKINSKKFTPNCNNQTANKLKTGQREKILTLIRENKL